MSVLKFGGERVHGIVSDMHEGYGFIEHCDRPGNVYFHIRDVIVLQRDQKLVSGE